MQDASPSPDSFAAEAVSAPIGAAMWLMSFHTVHLALEKIWSCAGRGNHGAWRTIVMLCNDNVL